MNRKKCSTCGEEKPREEFHKSRSMKDGLQGNCKPCNKASATNWQRENREVKRSYDAAYKAKLRLKTLDALRSMSMPPTPASVLAALGEQYTRDTSPVCAAVDVLLAVADWGSDEWQRLQEIASELTPEWFEEQYAYQHKVIEEYENSRNAAA